MSVQPEVIKIPSRFGITTHNTLLKQEVGADKLLIMLPGRAYTCDFPILYYLRSAAVQQGYDVLSIEYGFQAAHTDFSPQQAPDLVADLNDAIQPVLARHYKHVCVAGKSLGTPLAANLVRSITDASVSLLLLTPIGDLTKGLDTIRTLVIIGTSDPVYSADEVTVFKDHPNVKWRVFDGLNHGLEVTDHWRESIAVIPEIIEVCAEFLRRIPMILTSGIVIFAPLEVQAVAIPIMRQIMPESLIRIPAHVTLMFPFVAHERLDAAAQTLQSICATIEPFEITLAGYGQFPGIVFMQPANPELIKAVFRKIYAAFPECPPYGGAFGDDIHPHVTVGEFKSEDEQHTVWLPDYAPITFRAERLHLIYEVYDEPLLGVTHSVIPFGRP